MVQQIITWLLVGIAALLILRHVWAEVEGFIRPEKAGGCPGCGMCDAAKEEAASKGPRPAPVAKVTPLVPMKTTQASLPPHLQHLRKAKPKSESGA